MNGTIIKIKELLSSNRAFLIPYLLFVLIATILLLFTKKGDFLMFLNSHHNIYLDYFYKYITNLGEGYFFLIIIIFLGLYRVKYFVQGLIMFIFTGIFTQILKHIFEYPRPITYFADTVYLNFVDGVTVHSFNSFPSGHTTSTFTIFIFFSFLVRNSLLKFSFFIIALNVAISRIYLVQHFLEDIYVGSMIGTVFSIIMYYYLENLPKLNNSNWYNYQIIRSKLL